MATVVAGIALTGAWAWLWSTAPVARSLGSRAENAGAAAYALRIVRHELRDSVALSTPTACSADRGLLLEHRHPGLAPETIPIVWDAARKVLWRKTSSTYLADHVSRFAVSYLDEVGQPILPGPPGQRLDDLASVHVVIAVSAGGREEELWCDVPTRTP